MRGVAGADHLRRLDERLRLDAHRLGADHPEVLRDEHDGDRDRRGEDAAPQARLAAADHDRHRRSRAAATGTRRSASQIDDEHAVEPAAEVAGDQAEQHADEDREHDRDDDHEERGLRAPDHPGEHVVAADGGAEQVLGGRRLLRAERRRRRRAAGRSRTARAAARRSRSAGRTPVSTRPATSMPRCRPTLCRSWWTTGSRVQQAAACGRRSAVISVPHPRVDERGDDVDDEVGQRDDHREQGDDALHGDEVAGLQVLRRAGSRGPSTRRSSR